VVDRFVYTTSSLLVKQAASFKPCRMPSIAEYGAHCAFAFYRVILLSCFSFFVNIDSDFIVSSCRMVRDKYVDVVW